MPLDKKRTMTRVASVSYDVSKYRCVHFHATPSAAAVVLAPGYFNDMRGDLQVNDLIMVIASADAVGDAFNVKVTAVPAAPGNVTVQADTDVAGGGTRAVVPTADGTGTGVILPTDKFVEATSGNADHILTLPLASEATRGKEIWIWVVAGTNCELRTPAASNQTINNVDADGTAEALLTHTQLYVCRQHLATGWLLQAITALGAAAAAIVPD
ncbi:MAG: hypothetical protein KIS96_14460 [Bauldia sp.]|nr:hypothetical protein [Bauldia sp.]